MLSLGLSQSLCEGEVHVWWAHLDQAGTRVRQLARNLCDDERSRAERFLRERDKQRFIVCHGLLRELLGRYVHLSAGELCFRYGHCGKPYLAEPRSARALRFNLSRSGGMAVFAFTLGREIGIDLEQVRPEVPWEDLATHAFSRAESERLHDLPGVARQRAFFVAWTGKEAYVKARGCGLSFPPDQVEVGLDPLALSRIGDDAREASRWSLWQVGVDDHYVAAVAVEGHDWKLSCREWPWV